jgi:signal transduction histidine kinase
MSAPGLHVVVTADLRVFTAGGEDSRTMGKNPGDFAGQDIFGALFGDSNDPAAAADAADLSRSVDVARHHRRATTAVRRYRRENPTGPPEARRRTATSWPVLDPDGEVRHLVHRVEDVLELPADDITLTQIGHDLRGPLTAILGFGELLSLAGLADEQQAWAEAIVNASEQLRRIIEDTLER